MRGWRTVMWARCTLTKAYMLFLARAGSKNSLGFAMVATAAKGTESQPNAAARSSSRRVCCDT